MEELVLSFEFFVKHGSKDPSFVITFLILKYFYVKHRKLIRFPVKQNDLKSFKIHHRVSNSYIFMGFLDKV